MDYHVVELSRSIIKRGPALWLLIAELVYYFVMTAYVVYRWIRGKKTAVTEHRREWKSYRRERLERYRPERDRKHPNYPRGEG